MAKNWWKILAALLVMYATVFSFFRPLEPGLLPLTDGDLKTGVNSVQISGYNTHFKDQESSLKAFLKVDSLHDICCEIAQITDNNHLTLTADIPKEIPSKVLDLFITNGRDGTIFLERAFYTAEADSGSMTSTCKGVFQSGIKVPYEFPFQPLIFDTIRNLNFHVPMWFTMFVLMGIALVSSIMYLATEKKIWDKRALSATRVAIFFCVLGLITGSIWARFTWGDWWTNDAKLNGAAVSFLLLSAYLILRNSAENLSNAERIAAVYNIISFFMVMALIMVLPRMLGADTLHPGEDGNPAFSQYDLDSNLRMVFYPACAGWIMTGIWIYQLRLRIAKLETT